MRGAPPAPPVSRWTHLRSGLELSVGRLDGRTDGRTVGRTGHGSGEEALESQTHYDTLTHTNTLTLNHQLEAQWQSKNTTLYTTRRSPSVFAQENKNHSEARKQTRPLWPRPPRLLCWPDVEASVWHDISGPNTSKPMHSICCFQCIFMMMMMVILNIFWFFVLISLFWCQHEIVGENLRLRTETDDEFMFPATLPTDDAMNVGLIDGCYYYFLLYFG